MSQLHHYEGGGFNPFLNKTEEEWAEIAYNNLETGATEKYVVLGLLSGMTIAAFLTPAVGVIVAGWCLWTGIDKDNKARKGQEAISNYNLVAHALEQSDLQAYQKAKGLQYVLSQLKYAQETHLPLSPAALDLLDEVEDGAYDNQLNALPGSTPLMETTPPVVSPVLTLSSQQDAGPATVPPHATVTTVDINPEVAQHKARLGKLAPSKRSLLIIGGTGAGKSVLGAYLLSFLSQNCPKAEVFVCSQKYDSYGGLLESERVWVYERSNPNSILEPINKVYRIYDERRKIPEGADRKNLPPVRLILGDWTAISESLSKEKQVEDYASKLLDIILVGREFNVTLWADLQTFNVAALGFAKSDTNIRMNFNLVGLGNYSVDEDDGSVNESYGVLANLLGNQHIVADKQERQSLAAKFYSHMAESREKSQPICFLSVSPASVFLVPDLREYKDQKPFAKKSATRPQSSAPASASAMPPSETDKLIALMERTERKPLALFIKQNLHSGHLPQDRLNTLVRGIIKTLRSRNRQDLIDKFDWVVEDKKKDGKPDYSVRYEYSHYAKNCAITHQATGGTCCCCNAVPSKEIHHTSYRGEEDEPGVNLFPVCERCHSEICHSKDNWVTDPDNPVWGNHSTPGFAKALQHNYQQLESNNRETGVV